jgi:hypothetical protein
MDNIEKSNSILYLLVSEDKTLFKIGITDDIEARHSRLSTVWGNFDLALSCTVNGVRHDICRLEKTLHFLLEKWRIQHTIKAEGHSEWFSMNCFDKALEIISSAAIIRGAYSENLITSGISLPKTEKICKNILEDNSNHAINFARQSNWRAAQSTFSAGIVGEKRGVPVYTSNPSIPAQEDIGRFRRTQIGNDQRGLIIHEGTGEILGTGGAVVYEWEEVDKERFVKLFLAGVKQAAGLSKAGLAIFEVVYNQLRDHPNSDEVKLNFYVASGGIEGVTARTYQRGLRELLKKEFLYRSPSEGVFFVNIRYMFNGDRLAFVKAYHLAGAAEAKQAARKRAAKKRRAAADLLPGS